MNESHLDTTHFSITILQYPRYTDLQHTLSLPSSPKQRPDHLTTTLPQLTGKSWREACVCLSSACQRCPRQRGVRIHTGTTILSACGTGGDRRDRQSKQKLRGDDYHLGLPMSKGISDGKVSHLPLPQPSQNTLQCCDTKAASM